MLTLAQQEADSGMYTCVASSPTGESSWSGMLTVRGTRESLCYRTHHLQNLSLSQSSTEGAVSSPSRISEFIQLPGPPQKPVVTDVTRNSVTLTWQSNPHEGGAAVTSYVLEAFRYGRHRSALNGHFIRYTCATSCGGRKRKKCLIQSW